VRNNEASSTFLPTTSVRKMLTVAAGFSGAGAEGCFETEISGEGLGEVSDTKLTTMAIITPAAATTSTPISASQGQTTGSLVSGSVSGVGPKSLTLVTGALSGSKTSVTETPSSCNLSALALFDRSRAVPGRWFGFLARQDITRS
jgi:hypothetical protein